MELALITSQYCMCILCEHQDVLVEEDSGADNKLEDVLQSLHGLQQLFCQLLSVVHVVLQDFGQLPKNTNKLRTKMGYNLL